MIRIKNYILSFKKDDLLEKEIEPNFFYRGVKIEDFLKEILKEGDYALLRVRNYTFYYIKDRDTVCIYDRHVLLEKILFSLKNRISYVDSKDFLNRNPKLKVLRIVFGKNVN